MSTFESQSEIDSSSEADDVDECLLLLLAATGADFGHSFLPTFQSSFYYAWLQGALPLNGVSLAARQCLIGGNCE